MGWDGIHYRVKIYLAVYVLILVEVSILNQHPAGYHPHDNID